MSIIGSGDTDTTQTFDLGNLIIGDQTLNFATLSRPVVSAMLDILANDGDTKLLQEPQVTTMNNSPASIVVGTTIPLLVPQGKGSVFGTNPYTYEDQHINVSPLFTLTLVLVDLVEIMGRLSDPTKPIIA